MVARLVAHKTARVGLLTVPASKVIYEGRYRDVEVMLVRYAYQHHARCRVTTRSEQRELDADN